MSSKHGWTLCISFKYKNLCVATCTVLRRLEMTTGTNYFMFLYLVTFPAIFVLCMHAWLANNSHKTEDVPRYILFREDLWVNGASKFPMGAALIKCFLRVCHDSLIAVHVHMGSVIPCLYLLHCAFSASQLAHAKLYADKRMQCLVHHYLPEFCSWSLAFQVDEAVHSPLMLLHKQKEYGTLHKCTDT